MNIARGYWVHCKHRTDRTEAYPVQTSYVLLVEEGKINHWLFIRLQINLNLVFMSIPYLSSQSSFSSFLFLPTWPEGAVRSLNALALLWAHIDCLYPLQSQSGQSAWGTGCLLYPPWLTFFWEIKEGERESRSEFLLHSCKQRTRCICFTPPSLPLPLFFSLSRLSSQWLYSKGNQ